MYAEPLPPATPTAERSACGYADVGTPLKPMKCVVVDTLPSGARDATTL